MSKQKNLNLEDMYERLQQSPLLDKRIPTHECIRNIQNGVQVREHNKRKRLVWKGAAAFLCCIILVIAMGIAYEMPCGLADRRYSQAIGLDETMHIPFGRTPEEAVQKFRHLPDMQVIHQELVEGGVLLFIKRFNQQDGNDLQVEYVRKTFFGWKWVMGGGLGLSKVANPALDYMFMSKYAGIQTPFPMAYGDVLDTSIKDVDIVTNGQSPGKYTAKLVLTETGHTIWFAFLPSTATTPYKIEALNEKGDIIARKTIGDPQGFGAVLLTMSE
jgi:hypothetical protein